MYLVSEIVPRYVEPHPQHPPLSTVLTQEIELGRLPDGYIAPRAGGDTVKISLNQLRGGPAQRYHASALVAINQGILGALNRQGLGGVTVQTNPADIDPFTGKDRRAPGQDEVRIEIATGRIGELRVAELETFGFGRRISEDESAGSPLHERIKARSPIQPLGSVREGATDLLRTNLLENYVAYLNRHPGRSVVAEISPSRIQRGLAYLDYKIVEDKPWGAYIQTSKTGTEQTNDWRTRFGFRHTQLTGEDDILRIDYVTGGNLKEVHSFFASYEASAPFLNRLRWQANAAFSDYDASEVGSSNARFEGRQYNFGFELSQNVFQSRQFFVDLVGGARWMSVRVDNKLVGTEGHEDFWLPRVSLRAERRTTASSFFADVGLERSLGGGSSIDEDELPLLGRIKPDRRWMVLRWNANFSTYLEPIFASLLPGRVERTGRAHELVFRFRGQEAFDNRLIPQEEMIAGGLYTVRGYPQAALAGDSVTVSSVEYKFHLPRILGVRRQTVKLPLLGDFRLARQHAAGRPDWDLVLSTFVDLGTVRQSQKRNGEIQSSLFGAGVGAELQIRENISLRYNLGVALHELENIVGGDIAGRGDFEHHLEFSVLY